MKYEYVPEPHGCVVPCIDLKRGETGIIHRVSLYQSYDYLRGEVIDDAQTLISLEKVLGRGEHQILEVMSDQDLDRVITFTRSGREHPDLPMSELMEIRELEQTLRREMGKYRSEAKSI